MAGRYGSLLFAFELVIDFGAGFVFVTPGSVARFFTGRLVGLASALDYGVMRGLVMGRAMGERYAARSHERYRQHGGERNQPLDHGISSR
jgi:hypothetical protein